MHLQNPTMFAFLAILVLAAPTVALTQLSVQQLRQMTDQGVTSPDYIFGVVMMNLPYELRLRVQSALYGARLSTGFAGRNVFGSSVVSPDLPRASMPLPQTNEEKDTESTSSSVVNSTDDEPITLNAGGRTKRSFADFFHGNSFPSLGGYAQPAGGFGNHGSFGVFGNPDIFNDGNGKSSFGFGDHGTNSYGRGYFDKENCPKQTDQGSIYQYGNDPMIYPALDISNELFARSLPGSDLLFQALTRQLVFPTDPPAVLVDDFLVNANASCPASKQQLWSYESVTFTGRCYPLVNFQEDPFYKTCLTRFCENCGNKKKNFINSPFWHQSHSQATHPANICATEYTTLSLWSYCEQLLPNRRIVRDRILVPTACNCNTVLCPLTKAH